MLVRDLMTREVVTCDAGVTVRDAAERMLDTEIGSVLITKDGTPLAILTETDIVRVGVVTGRALDDIPVDKAASHPLETIAPDATIRSAVKRMNDGEIKKLPVVEDAELEGIVTHGDIVAHYSDFVREAHRLDASASEWESDRDRR
ncbi:CBS domain-containing protein [Halobaculum rubrum]|uniref:CBS domain-containing protein n=1 Tax=Halobaculum rubrum TaxID=2872158 RepID=UPI001CA46CAD|nr:CBS domain-containing protein [Halobaculum rubrum]QZX99196.1 CBS domain-containing protein [Halobaculum rubrum]